VGASATLEHLLRTNFRISATVVAALLAEDARRSE
jgi:hypothetical protein